MLRKNDEGLRSPLLVKLAVGDSYTNQRVVERIGGGEGSRPMGHIQQQWPEEIDLKVRMVKTTPSPQLDLECGTPGQNHPSSDSGHRSSLGDQP